MTSTEPIWLSLVLLIAISSIFLLHDSWTSHGRLDKGALTDAKRLLRRATLAGIILLISTVAVGFSLLPGVTSPRLTALSLILLIPGALLTLNARHRIRQEFG